MKISTLCLPEAIWMCSNVAHIGLKEAENLAWLPASGNLKMIYMAQNHKIDFPLHSHLQG